MLLLRPCCELVVADVRRLWKCCLGRSGRLVGVLSGGKCSICSFQWTTEMDGERSVWKLFWDAHSWSVMSTHGVS